jgi:hypothetical protein
MSDQSRTGAPEAEITPEMIGAGLAVLYKSGAIEHQIEDLDRQTVRRLFVAMLEARYS